MKNTKSLKPLLIKIFLLGPIIIFFWITALSFHSINSLMTNKIELTITDTLNGFASQIDDTITSLNQAVYQFTDGSIGESIILLDYALPYEKTQLVNNIREQIELISFTYNNLRVITFYKMNSKEFLYSNKTINIECEPESFPVLLQKNQFIYSVPHYSIDKYSYNTTPVISLLKKINHPNISDLYIYLESNFDYREPEHRSDLFMKKDFFLITSTDGNIIFTEQKDIFPIGTKYQKKANNDFPYYTYMEQTQSNYVIYYFVPKSEYNQEKYTWISQMLLLFSLYTIFVTVSFIYLWRKILRPIKQMEDEIKVISIGDLSTTPRFTGVLEFDRLIEEIIHMKQEISNLISQTREQEAKEAQLEIEKLMYQINPHFLMNSLNTIYWMTTMNNQPQIGKSISALNKLLQYNLKHEQSMVPLYEEVNALQQYILLQKLRYDFHYHFICHDEKLKNFMVPRFILQPLVENSISHGLKDDNGLITITIRRSNGLEIEIADNGYGISPQSVRQLMDLQNAPVPTHKMGIGINYVIKILRNRYGNKAHVKISSQLGNGTTILLHIPFEGGDLYDKSNDSRR